MGGIQLQELTAPQATRVTAGHVAVPANIKNLDVMRSFAVLLVVLAHSVGMIGLGSVEARGRIEVDLGRFGVLLFFVHTTLVLMMSLERTSPDQHWQIAFYLRRIFRIYPLSIACIAVVLLFRIPPLPPTFFQWPSTAKILANIGLVQNFVTPQSFIGANFAANSSLCNPMWSLPFEVQMYLLLPGIFCFARRYKLEGACLLTGVSIIIAMIERSLWPERAWLTEFFPCFMGGVVAYTTLGRRPLIPGTSWPLGIGAVAITCFALGMSTVAQWAACLLLGSVITMFRDIPEGFFSKAAAVVARYSYGIYLAHMPIRWLCFDHISASTPIRWGLFGMLLCVVPFLLYHVIEAPMVRLGHRITLPVTNP
jgi:peptidoglycan/LPS O-acetylase OafA/YrhL